MEPSLSYCRFWQSIQRREGRFHAKVLKPYLAAELPTGLQIRAAAGTAEPIEILLYDEIGYFGVTAKDFALALADIPAERSIRVRINSPGGDVFDGVAIYNLLATRVGAVTCVVDGVAASIASFIACAGDRLDMAERAMLMIHNAWGAVVGDKSALRAMADVMGKIDGQLAATYAGKSGKPLADIVAMMDAETWLTAQDALDLGFCAAIDGSARAAARLARTPKASRVGRKDEAASRATRMRRLRLAEVES